MFKNCCHFFCFYLNLLFYKSGIRIIKISISMIINFKSWRTLIYASTTRKKKPDKGERGTHSRTRGVGYGGNCGTIKYENFMQLLLPSHVAYVSNTLIYLQPSSLEHSFNFMRTKESEGSRAGCEKWFYYLSFWVLNLKSWRRCVRGCSKGARFHAELLWLEIYGLKFSYKAN